MLHSKDLRNITIGYPPKRAPPPERPHVDRRRFQPRRRPRQLPHRPRPQQGILPSSPSRCWSCRGRSSSCDSLKSPKKRGLKKSARQGRIDAYAAMRVLERYFSTSGSGAELVLPKKLELQEKLLKGPHRELDF